MQHTLAAVFDNRTSAQQAMDELVRCGFPKEDLALKDATSAAASSAGAGTTTGGVSTEEGEREESFGQSVKHFFSDLFGTGHADTHVYAEAVRRGNTVLTYETDDQDRVERAADIIEGYGPIDIDEHESQWRASGWTGAESARSGGYQAGAPSSLQSAQQGTRQGLEQGSRATGASASLQSGTAAGSAQRGAEGRPIPVMKEDLKVGKRTVQTGGVRVYSRLVETPVEQDIRLREEHVKVERHPVDRPIDPSEMAAFKEASFEVRESAEEAVVEKSARVIEEVVVNKEVSEHDKHISDKVRRTEVQVEQLGAGESGRGAITSADEDSYYRSHWTSSLAGQGGQYEDYEPAYRYGWSMASAEMFRNRPWDEAEPALRSDWERSHPGSAWDRFKDAVRHGWDRMTSSGYESDYRSHWDSNYAAQGGKYEDYDPAYRYGSTVASNASYRGRQWDDIEPELKSDWERTHPGSAWDRFKAAARHGWERATGSSGDDTYYRSHYSTTYGAQGGSYDEYAPAYRYGSSMAGSDSYRGRQWDEVEPQLRSDWEQRYPGSAWERFKAAVRHGWDRITS